MTILDPARLTEPVFGAGPSASYAVALRTETDLVLHRNDGSEELLPVTRWLEGPDEADLGVLREAAGPVLDVGCGPGRMLFAAAQEGLVAVGIDTEEAATDLARQKGFDAITGSIFDPLPGEVLFGSVLLLDGNIGIGADPAALLARCRDLLAPSGTVIVETHPDADRDDVFRAHLTPANGKGRSDTFPWAEIGAVPLTGYAAKAGLYLVQHRTVNHRTFVHLQPRSQ